MTGGQHSVTTPAGSITATTPTGNIERPLDICATVAANGASYVYRNTVFAPDLTDQIATAIQQRGFSLLDIWELCTAYFVPNNHFSRQALLKTLEQLSLPTGLLHRTDYPEYATALRQAYASEVGKPFTPPRWITAQFTAKLEQKFNLVVAGSAGGKVRSAARLVGLAGILAGVWAAQRDDYPVTVKAGHSVSHIILSPTEILYTGLTRPDALIILTTDGYKQVAHYLPAMTPADWVFITPEFSHVSTPARKIELDWQKAAHPISKAGHALAALAAALAHLDIIPIAALEEAARQDNPRYAEDNLQAIATGLTLLSH
jgi:Pyruvate/2-oxoacid:ferredoxin oxidoreductase gamma subunit